MQPDLTNRQLLVQGADVLGKSVQVLTADPAEPSTPTERVFAEVLAEVVGVERVSVDSHFFDDLGADSLVMAQFCARVRKRADLPSVSMKDVYRHSTIRSLATGLTSAAPAPLEPSVPAPPQVAKPVSTPRYVLCGALQVLLFLASSFLTAFVAVRGYEWIAAGSGWLDVYLRSVVFGGASFFALSILPILVKWIFIGRWKPQQIPLWSLAYVRFWLVKTLLRANPMVLFVGSPLYVLYLRALGAKIGRGVVILSRNVPVCADLLTIGEDTVIRKDSFFTCFRAHSGAIQTGPVTLGRNVFVGEKAVLDIQTSMGDGAQLGHVSSLQAGQAVPAAERWHGSPAQLTEVDYRVVPTTSRSMLRAGFYSVGQLLTMLFLYLPVVLGVLDVLVVPRIGGLLVSAGAGVTGWAFYLDALIFSVVLFSGALLVALVFMLTVPRVLSLAIKPDQVYPMYGFHYSLHRAIARVTNSRVMTAVFGDSSYVVPYLRGLGYKLSPVVQTGSNFGTEIKHESPYLCSVGTGTVVASGISIANADYSSTSFRLSRASIGSNSFFGNEIVYPSQSRAGDNCLLGTKVMVPMDGKVRENVGLLGSPPFEIPRTVARDSRFDHLKSGDELRHRLAAKNRHNLVTIGLFLLTRWVYVFAAVLIGFCAVALYPLIGLSAVALGVVLTMLFRLAFGVLVERASTGFRPLPRKYCSIYEIDFWRTERFFKLEAEISPIFNGTPFKGMIFRMLGVRVGRRFFDDGAQIAEKNLVTIGDDVSVNFGAWIQCHSQEDFVFKSDSITIGSGCTIGVNSMILYSVTMGDGAVLAPDSFLMKGEEMPPHAQWGGNPAREMPAAPLDLQVRGDDNAKVRAALVGGR
jgi:non-ribosomal peptide synthetase-like protein